jgi:hypothetical protein
MLLHHATLGQIAVVVLFSAPALQRAWRFTTWCRFFSRHQIQVFDPPKCQAEIDCKSELDDWI